VVLGFLCNEFNEEEPGSSRDINRWYKKNYNITFPLFRKIKIKGKG